MLFLGIFSGVVYSLHTWGRCMFVSGGQDKTARFWDLRASTPITVIPSPTGGYYYCFLIFAWSFLFVYIGITLRCI